MVILSRLPRKRRLYSSDTAENDEKFVVPNGIRACILRYLDHCHTYRAIESTGIGIEFFRLINTRRCEFESCSVCIASMYVDKIMYTHVCSWQLSCASFLSQSRCSTIIVGNRDSLQVQANARLCGGNCF